MVLVKSYSVNNLISCRWLTLCIPSDGGIAFEEGDAADETPLEDEGVLLPMMSAFVTLVLMMIGVWTSSLDWFAWLFANKPLFPVFGRLLDWRMKENDIVLIWEYHITSCEMLTFRMLIS